MKNESERCPFCGNDLRPGAKFCMKCGKPIKDTKVSKESNYINETAQKTSDSTANSSNPSKPADSKSPKMSVRKKAAIITSCVAAAILLVVVVIVLSMPKGTTDTGEGYEISGQRIAYANGSYFMKGVAKNTTGHQEAFSLKWKVYDKDEQEIGQASVMVGPLEDGQSQEFEAQITSSTSIYDLFFSEGQTTQTGGPDHFELSEVKLYTENSGDFMSPFSDMFGGFSNWFF